jgi:hypothetical protein
VSRWCFYDGLSFIYISHALTLHSEDVLLLRVIFFQFFCLFFGGCTEIGQQRRVTLIEEDFVVVWLLSPTMAILNDEIRRVIIYLLTDEIRSDCTYSHKQKRLSFHRFISLDRGELLAMCYTM